LIQTQVSLSQLKKEKTDLLLEMEHLKELHATDKEKLVNDLMIAKKEIENLLRTVRRLEGDKEKITADKENFR
jgi:hypothetical protein